MVKEVKYTLKNQLLLPKLESLLFYLAAVLHPTQGGWFYYVLVPDGTKRHVFSRTLREHNGHVQTLVHEQNRQKQIQRKRKTPLSIEKKDTK